MSYGAGGNITGVFQITSVFQHADKGQATLLHTRLLDGPFWQRVPAYAAIGEAEFLDHKWQAKHSITNIPKLLAALSGLVSEDFIKDAERGFAGAPMSVRVSPYLLSLIDWSRPYEDPLRLQFIPLGFVFVPLNVAGYIGLAAEKTNAALCPEPALEGRESSLTAKSWRFHSQLPMARARPRNKRSGSAAARSLIAAVTRWRRASYKRVSSKLRTGTPMVRRSRAIACSISAPRGSVSSKVSRSSRRSGSRCKSRGSTGSRGLLASDASTSKNQRSCATKRAERAVM